MNRISILPSETISKLRTGVAITSISQCIEELVLNSVDANSTCIAVRIDVPSFRIQVIDNGIGIDKDQFIFLGERYATSKNSHVLNSKAPNTHGYRGEALASIREVSRILVIESRTFSFDCESHVKTFVKNASHSVKKSTHLRASCGTTVTILDFMYNLPVRRQKIHEVYDLEIIKERLEAITLIHPEISLTFRDDFNHSTLIQATKVESSLLRFSNFYGKPKATCMKSVTINENPFYVSGYIGTIGNQHKKRQYLYINKHFITSSKIHKFINRMCCRTSISRSTGLTSLRIPSDFTSNSVSRSFDHWCMFILNVNCSREIYDISMEPQKSVVEFKNWDAVFKLMEKLFSKFFVDNNLLGDNFNRETLGTIISPSKRTHKDSVNTKRHLVKERQLEILIDAKVVKDAIWSLPVKRTSNNSHCNPDFKCQKMDIGFESPFFLASNSKQYNSSEDNDETPLPKKKSVACISRFSSMKSTRSSVNTLGNRKFHSNFKKFKFNQKPSQKIIKPILGNENPKESCSERQLEELLNKRDENVTFEGFVQDTNNELKEQVIGEEHCDDEMKTKELKANINSIIKNDKFIVNKDDLGNIVYIDKYSGNSYFKLPESNNPNFAQSNVEISEQTMSNSSSSNCLSSIVDCNKLCTNEVGKFPQSFSKDSDLLFSNWNNPIFKAEKQVISNDSSSKCNIIKSQNALLPHKFDKTMFNSLEILGQIDKKFILCSSKSIKTSSSVNNLLLLFDQHAVHERIRVEFLTKSLFDDPNGNVIKSVKLDTCLSISIDENSERLLKGLKDEFLRIGIEFSTIDDGIAKVLSVPDCIMTKELDEVQRDRKSILTESITEIINEELYSKTSTHGAKLGIPKTIWEMVCSKACRGAIKFGHALSIDRCRQLMIQLVHCDLPFQCAHGRPSFIPLLDLDNCNNFKANKVNMPNLLKLKKS